VADSEVICTIAAVSQRSVNDISHAAFCRRLKTKLFSLSDYLSVCRLGYVVALCLEGAAEHQLIGAIAH